MNYTPETLRELNIITNNFYTNQVDSVIKPKLVAIYENIVENVGYDNQIWYGDADVYVHIERIGDFEDVIIIRNVVTCFDNCNIFAVINKETKYISICKCVESQGEKKEGYDFDDHRDWKIKGLDTYRNNDFDFGYNDCRDPDLVFEKSSSWDFDGANYNSWNVYSSSCGFIQQNIQYVMQEVDYAHFNIVENMFYTLEEKIL